MLAQKESKVEKEKRLQVKKGGGNAGWIKPHKKRAPKFEGSRSAEMKEHKKKS